MLPAMRGRPWHTCSMHDLCLVPSALDPEAQPKSRTSSNRSSPRPLVDAPDIKMLYSVKVAGL
jgi:hypothetical protein